MDLMTARCGACVVSFEERLLPDGRPVILIRIRGFGTTAEVAVCLAEIMQSRQYPKRCLAVIDPSHSQRQTDALGLFRQAEVLASAGIRHLSVCYLSDSEAAAAVIPFMQQIYREAGILTDTWLCRTLDEAMDWLAVQP